MQALNRREFIVKLIIEGAKYVKNHSPLAGLASKEFELKSTPDKGTSLNPRLYIPTLRISEFFWNQEFKPEYSKVLKKKNVHVKAIHLPKMDGEQITVSVANWRNNSKYSDTLNIFVTTDDTIMYGDKGLDGMCDWVESIDRRENRSVLFARSRGDSMQHGIKYQKPYRDLVMRLNNWTHTEYFTQV